MIARETVEEVLNGPGAEAAPATVPDGAAPSRSGHSDEVRRHSLNPRLKPGTDERRALGPGIQVISPHRTAGARPSNQVSNDRHRQQWTPEDTHGRLATGRARCGAGGSRQYI